MKMKGSNNFMNIILFILYVFLSSSGLILFKLGVNNANIHFNLFGLSIGLSLQMIFGIICYGLSFLLWLYLISKLNLTFAMPLSVALVNTLVLIGSCLFLNEKITLMQGIGIFIIILGVSLITWGKK